jgi:hypothetical protein
MVPAQGVYDDEEFDGKMIGKINRSTSPSAILSPTNFTLPDGREPGQPRWEASD